MKKMKKLSFFYYLKKRKYLSWISTLKNDNPDVSANNSKI